MGRCNPWIKAVNPRGHRGLPDDGPCRRGALPGVILALAVLPALAANDSDEYKGALEQIVVTAQRDAQKIQDVPLSITAVPGIAIEKLHLRDLSDASILATGLNITFNGTVAVPTLRGVSYDVLSSAQATVDFYWNDTPIDSEGAMRSLFDIQQLEIIRGPQSTLRGGTAPSGAITVTTRLPDMTSIEGFVQQDFSDRRLFTTQGAVSLPIMPGAKLTGVGRKTPSCQHIL